MSFVDEKFVQRRSFRLEGDDISSPLKAVKGLSSKSTPTQANVGCGKKGRTVFRPTATTADPPVMIIVFNHTDKSQKLWEWVLECTGAERDNVEHKDISVIVYDENLKEVISYRLTDCFPHSFDASDLDANSNELAEIVVALSASSMKIEKA